MKQIVGQMSLESIVQTKSNCNGCDVEWCSMTCFKRRGYIYDRLHGFARNAEGKPHRIRLDSRECKIGVANFE